MAWTRKTALVGGLVAVCAALAGPLTAQPASDVVRPRHTEADVQFMAGMIPHHAQALEMTALVPDRTTRREIRLIAERIEVAQADEIAWMTRWLEDHGAQAPAHATHGGHLMPGMLTPEELAELEVSTGARFDRLFLLYMIRHHQGALLMVADLFATPGAAQAPEVFRFATDINADQQAEIDRMTGLLDVPTLPAPHAH